MPEAKKPRTRLAPLKLSCDSADCDKDLHCFRESKKRAPHPSGACQQCGGELVDWDRVRKRDPKDVTHTLDALKREWIRHHFWHVEISQRALNYALRKGRSGLRERALTQVRKSIGLKHSRDGQQTPWDGNVLHYAQHATATCCRRCVECWHGIAPEQELSDEQIQYFAHLCLQYVFEKLPDLPSEGQSMASIRPPHRMHDR